MNVKRIAARLDGVRRSIAAWFWVEGLARVLWMLLAIAAMDLVLDWLFRMDLAQRAVMLAIMVLVLLAGIYRWLVRPLTTEISDDSLVLQIERSNPRLGQALITSLQLSRSESRQPHGMSASLMRRAIALGVNTAEEVRFADIVESRRFARNAMQLAAAIAILLMLVAATPFVPPLRIWFSRNVLLGRTTWPQNTYLVIDRLRDDGTVVFPKGTTWTQVISIRDDSHIVPDAVYLDIQEPRSGRNRRSLLLDRTSEQRFEATFTGVTEPFEFRARGGDAITDWVRVELADRPALDDLKISSVTPRYAGQVVEELSPGQSPYNVLRGSSVRLAGVVNTPLSTAELVHGDKRWPLHFAETGDSLKVALELSPDNLQDGPYGVELVDTLGLFGRAAEFGIRWRLDREPEVSGSLEDIGAVVLPQSKVPFHCQAKDDYGLTGFSLVLNGSQDGNAVNQHRLPLLKTNEAHAVGQPTNLREAIVADEIELEPLKLMAGTNLKVQFEATDNDDVTGPHVGRSSTFFLRVVDENEFRSDLLRRERAERQELEQLVKSQDDLVTDTRALAAAVSSVAGASSDAAEQLQRSYRSQKAIGQKLAAVADRVRKMSREIRINRLPDVSGRLYNRLANEIAAPLTSVAMERIPEAIHTIENLQILSGEDRKVAFGQLISQQSDAAAAIKRVLEQMTTNEGYQEAIDLLYEIQKAQSDVHEQTNKAREERIKRILEGRG